ncbi:MAG: efflux RND transporter periplasmic adaptor subunit [Cellvibrionaceae bacterium]|nr:efflux RND transporter periplasmic adaptor subunit [Cellvibrionaceae bacterium]
MRKVLIPVLIVIAFALVVALIMANPPSSSRKGQRPNANIPVEVQTVVARDFKLQLQSYGRIRPRTQSQLLPQVAGQIVWVSPKLRAGAFFEQGEALLRIDERDYQVALVKAEAGLASAQQLLSEEQGRVVQAKADWKRSGKKGKAPDLVLRKPQLAAAKAGLKSAEAALAQAELNLERTHIRAPYAGRVLSKSADLGQLVGTATTLATLYAVDYVEVRLPIKSRDLAFIDLPEQYRFGGEQQARPAVQLISELIGRETWQGQVVETEGAIDEASRQLYVIAQIDDPYGKASVGDDLQAKAPLKIGQYIKAKIEGRLIKDAIVVPNRLIYQGSYVYVEVQGKLMRRPVRIAWQDEQQALLSEGLAPGDRLITTNLGQLNSGTAVRVITDKPEPKKRRLGVKGQAPKPRGES